MINEQSIDLKQTNKKQEQEQEEEEEDCLGLDVKRRNSQM